MSLEIQKRAPFSSEILYTFYSAVDDWKERVWYTLTEVVDATNTGSVEIDPEVEDRVALEYQSTSIGTTDDLTAFSRPDTTTDQETEWAALEIAAEAGDERAFINAVQPIDWNRCSAEDFVRVVRLAFSADAHLLARKFAEQGARRYPNHSELHKMAQILAPPKVIRTHSVENSAINANTLWLRKHAEQYRGRWVALRNGTLLATAATVAQLQTELADFTNVMVTKVY